MAICRQLLSMLVLHFYDDFCFLGLSTEKCNKCIPLCVPRWVYAWTRPRNSFMRPVGVYTGAQFDRSNLLSKGHVVVSPKLGRCQALAGMIAEAREANRLTPAEASKLRGKSEYLSGQFMGRARKGCHQALAARQYHDKHVHLTPRLRGALDFLELAVGIVPFSAGSSFVAANVHCFMFGQMQCLSLDHQSAWAA